MNREETKMVADDLERIAALRREIEGYEEEISALKSAATVVEYEIEGLAVRVRKESRVNEEETRVLLGRAGA